jgi:hypothetical protein
MNTLEVIHLRLAGKPPENLCEQIKESIVARDDEELAAKLAVFRRDGLETDIAIHIYHDEKPDSGPGRLGLQLASELKTYGLVQHTFWEQVK